MQWNTEEQIVTIYDHINLLHILIHSENPPMSSIQTASVVYGLNNICSLTILDIIAYHTGLAQR